jgi:hypothetical protein
MGIVTWPFDVIRIVILLSDSYLYYSYIKVFKKSTCMLEERLEERG